MAEPGASQAGRVGSARDVADVPREREYGAARDLPRAAFVKVRSGPTLRLCGGGRSTLGNKEVERVGTLGCCLLSDESSFISSNGSL